MSESKVQPLASLYIRTLDILISLRVRHFVPDLLPSSVLIDVVRLSSEKECNRKNVDCDEGGISSSILRLVIVTVDEVGGHIAGLNCHL